MAEKINRDDPPKELADIAFTYLQISAEADHWMLTNQTTHEGNYLVGNLNILVTLYA